MSAPEFVNTTELEPALSVPLLTHASVLPLIVRVGVPVVAFSIPPDCMFIDFMIRPPVRVPSGKPVDGKTG